MADLVVLDASVMVDYLVGSPLAPSIDRRIADSDVHVPAHFDAEVLSALGRLNRAKLLSDTQVTERVELTAKAPFQRHLLSPLLPGAWLRRQNVRLVDALYVELGAQLDAPVLTTDAGLASSTPKAELVTG